MAAEEPALKKHKGDAGSEWLEKSVPDVTLDLGFGNPGNVSLVSSFLCTTPRQH